MRADVLSLVVCPACRSTLEHAAESVGCRGCGRVYPMRDGIPILIVDQTVSSGGNALPES